MKPVWTRTVAAVLCAVMLLGLLPLTLPIETQARNYGVYEDVAYVYDQGSCPSMQGMSVHGNYVYACKINGDTEASAVVARVNKNDGSTTFLTNAATGTKYFSDFGHGNDIEVETLGGVLTLFVPTSKSGSGSLVRYKISGTTATKVGSYNMVSTGGSSIGGGAIRVIHFDSDSVTFLFKSGRYCYTGTLPLSQTGGNIVMTSLCTLDYSSCYVNGTYKDTSGYSLQGMGYYDHKLYLPLSGHTLSGHENISIILVYDLEGASGTIKPDPDLTFQITSSYYGALFELESCEISPLDNRMYFSANRRRTNSDTNHDGVSYISNWTYDPAARTSEVNNYRWETRNDKLVSVTDGGNVYNGVHQLEGEISNGTYTDGRFSLSKNVVLSHDKPWVLEWKASGAWSSALFMATGAQSAITGLPFLFCNRSGDQICIGAYSGSQYNNYGISLSNHGIDATVEHIYRLTNKLASDGSNMIYLSVDGKELGPMNNHFIGGTAQGTTSDWVCGKDLKFSYFGTISHKLSGCKLDYIQVWGEGLASVKDEPNVYRWESGMTPVSQYGLTTNTATLVSGTVSGSNYTDCRYELSRDIVLMHNRPWVLEWENSGTWKGCLLLAADHMSNTYYAPYVFRSGSLIAIGYHTGSRHEQWGVKLSDYGIDINAQHIFALRNLIEADGSNMVWLYVDGEKVAPLTTFCTNGSATSTTSEYLAGKDFVLSYMGTYQHDVTGGMKYMQVWEAGKPEEDVENNYRWETQNDKLVSIENDTFESNPVSVLQGSCTDGVYENAQMMVETPVVLRHDRPWRMEWQTEGAWSGGGLFLSSTVSSYVANNCYLFRNSKVISLGTYTGERHEQRGFCPGDYGVDHNGLHTYTLVNKVSTDGSNMVYMYVDGVERGPMTTVSINGTTYGNSDHWVSGKDFTFSYLGTAEHTVKDTKLHYLQVFEGCVHTYGSWETVTEATCTTDGAVTRSCTVCGNVEDQVITAPGHRYEMQTTDAACGSYARYDFTCSACGDSYSLTADGLAEGWIDYLPAGMDPDLFHTKTQYRYSDYETTTSYETALEGYKQLSARWEPSGTGSVSYVNSWPSGFSTSSSLYTQYNQKSAKVSASETATAKTEVNSDGVTGYLYYHWCYNDSVYSVESGTGSYTTFHAYYSPTAPGNYTCDSSDMSYKTSQTSCCTNSEWFFVTEVYQQKYTCYQKLFTYERWAPFTDWSDTAVNASDTRKVETRTVYQLKEAPRGSHSYTAQVIAPTCTAQGYTRYTCSVCGDSYTDADTAALGHSYAGGVCTVCGCVDPAYDTNVDYYLFGYINGANYGCEEDYENMGIYKFTDGQLTVTFTQDSYVAVKTTNNACWFMTEGWQGNEVTEVTLYDTNTLFSADKLFVPGNVEVTFTLVNNGDGSLNLGYTPLIVNPTITLKYPTLSFEDEILMNVYFAADHLENVVQMGLITYSADVPEWNVDNAEAVIPGYSFVEEAGFYVATTEGIPAKCLGDTMYFAVYAKLTDGSYRYTRLVSYSPKTYAYTQLATGSGEMKPLVVAMLNYGAAAQSYFGYNTANLVNQDLTAAQKALISPYNSTMMNPVVNADSGKVGIFTNTGGFSRKYPTVSFEGAFCINYYFTPSAVPAGALKLYYWTQADYNAATTLTAENASGCILMANDGTGVYHAVVEGIAAKDLDQTLYVAAGYMREETSYCTGVLAYSIGAYCTVQASTANAQQAFAQATAVYGYYAKELFYN